MAAIVNLDAVKPLPVVDGYVAESENEDETDAINVKGIAIPERVKHHAKRTNKIPNQASVPQVEDNLSPTNLTVKKLMKNSRRSRSRFGRGLAKKGGAGGKGTWGRICEDYDADGAVLDSHDPNYDSDNMESYKIETIIPVLDENEIELYVKPIIAEYFEHGDTEEVINSLEDFNLGERVHLIVVLAVSLAMERKSSHREMTSILISDLYGSILNAEIIEEGFNVLLTMLPDLVLDTPNANIILGNFIARAVADDCVPPIYVQRAKETYTDKLMMSAIKQASQLLSSRHSLINVDRIWGLAGGMRPVKYLIKEMHLILEEFLTSNVLDDAGLCLKDLDVPHFHHEFVYEAIVKAIEDSKEQTIDKICSLLQYLFDCGIITLTQLKNGFTRVFEEMSDIVIDVPYAYELLENFKNKSVKLGFFPEELEKDMPTRGRKRFISEGDGGLVKA